MMHTIDGKTDLPLSAQALMRFRDEGVLYIRSFYDLESEIVPVLRDIHSVLGLIIEQHRLPIVQEKFTPERFDSGLQGLLNANRAVVGVLYDAVKKIPSYVRLASHPKNEELARALIGSDLIGFANRGYGIRMDNPTEDKYLTQWHQDYVSQLCSLRGVVLWSPLRSVTAELGPVEMCPASHRQGVFPIVRDGEGSYGLKIQDEDQIVRGYRSIVPEVAVGDMVVIDFLTLHRSTANRATETRWSMISRYFDFCEDTGKSYGWKGGLQEGNSFEKVHPDWCEIRN